MANVQSTTATHQPAQVTDPEGVTALVDEYELGDLNTALEGENENSLAVWGYGPFNIAATIGGDYVYRGITHEFLLRLTQYIEEGHVLDIRTVEHTKCRSVHGYRYQVFPDLVTFSGLDGQQYIVPPSDGLADVMDQPPLDDLYYVDDIDQYPEWVQKELTPTSNGRYQYQV